MLCFDPGLQRLKVAMGRGARLAVAAVSAIGIATLLAIPGNVVPIPPTFSQTIGPHPASGIRPGALPSFARSPTAPVGGPAASPSNPWSSVVTPTAPSPRGAPACATDRSSNVTYCYGGAGAGSTTVDNDTWSYVDGTWTNLTPQLTPSPGPVAGGMMVYDPTQSAFFLFGGLNGYGGYPNANTWKFTGTTWTNVTSTAGTAPSARYGGSFVYDPALGYPVLFGGWDTAGAWSDTWSLDAGTWSDLSTTVGVPPTARAWAASTYDPIRQSIVLVGGVGFGNSAFQDDTWELQAVSGQPAWMNISTSVGPAPSARRMAGLVFDPAVGGDLLTGGDYETSGGSWTTYQDVWVLQSAGWVDLTSSISAFPPARFEPAMFWDASIGVADLFAGCTSLACASAVNDTWEFSEGFTANLSAPSSTLVNTSFSLSGAAYGAPLGSRPAYSYNYSGLPPGCRSMNSSVLTCRPSATGRFDLRVNVTDLTAANGSANLYAVSPPTSVWVVQPVSGSFTLSRGSVDVGQDFWINLSATGGGGGFSYSYSGLPKGCTSRNVSNLDCAPAAAGAVSIDAIARDTLGNVVGDVLNVTVSPQIGVTGTESAALLDVGLPLYLNASVTGGSGGTVFTWSLPGQSCPTPAAAAQVCVLDAAGPMVPSVLGRDSNGGTATYRFPTVFVEPDPQVSFAAFPLGGASPLVVTFTTSTRGGVGPFTYSWEFGDGTSASFANGTHTYVAPGGFSGRLWVNDSLGLSAETSIHVAVELAPTVALTELPAVAEIGRTARLFANVTGGVAPLSFTWSGLPTGCPYENASELNCTPLLSGTFQVGVLVRDAYGASAARSAYFTIAPSLSVNISLTSGVPSACPPSQPVNFAAIVTGGTAPFSYFWWFGDGTESAQPDAVHNYTSKGATYTVELGVSDAAGVYRVANRTLTVVVPAATCPTEATSAGLPWTDIGIGAAAGAAGGAGVTGALLGRRGRPPDEGREPATEPRGAFWPAPDLPDESEP